MWLCGLYHSDRQGEELRQVSKKAQVLETWPSHSGQNKARKNALSPGLGGHPHTDGLKGEASQF